MYTHTGIHPHIRNRKNKRSLFVARIFPSKHIPLRGNAAGMGSTVLRGVVTGAGGDAGCCLIRATMFPRSENEKVEERGASRKMRSERKERKARAYFIYNAHRSKTENFLLFSFAFLSFFYFILFLILNYKIVCMEGLI